MEHTYTVLAEISVRLPVVIKWLHSSCSCKVSAHTVLHAAIKDSSTGRCFSISDGIRLTVTMWSMRWTCRCLCLLLAGAVWSAAGAGVTGWSVYDAVL